MPNTYSLDLERGSSQYAYAADSATWPTGDMTLECWVKMESAVPTNDEYGLFNRWQSGGQLSFNLYLGDYLGGDTHFDFYNSADGSATGYARKSYAVPVGTWTHIAVVYTAATPQCELFINGVSQGTFTNTGLKTSLFDSSANFTLGANNTGSLNFDGLIDEVRVWNDVRTAGEISGNYQNELVGNEQGLVAYWKLNNGYLDETANDNDLTASGSPVFSTDVPFGYQPRHGFVFHQNPGIV